MRISDLEAETDARVWVEAWLRTVEARPAMSSDPDVLLTWFENAIEVGRRAGRREGTGTATIVAKKDDELKAGVRRVLAAGLATGHADTWRDLLDAILVQYQELSQRARRDERRKRAD